MKVSRKQCSEPTNIVLDRIIPSYRPKKESEIVKLITRFQELKDDEGKRREASDILIEILSAYKPFMVNMMKPFNGRLSPEDQISACLEGAWKAAESFDPARGTKFITPLGIYITNALRTQASESITPGMRIPGYKQAELGRFNQLIAKEGELSPEQIAEKLEITTEAAIRLLELRSQMTGMHSMNASGGQEEDKEFGVTLADKSAASPGGALELSEELDKMFRIINHLVQQGIIDERAQTILFARSGIGRKDNKPATLEQLGKEVKLTRERIRQIEIEALERIKEHMNPKD